MNSENLNLCKRYHKETGLHAHYCTHVSNSGKRTLVFTRKYVWWLEDIIKRANKCIVCSSIANPLEIAENTYKILEGLDKR